MKLPCTRNAPIASLIVILVSVNVTVRAQSAWRAVGSVTDQQSAPIRDARISLYSVDRVLQTTSDSSGHFQFDPLPFGTYQMEVVAPGFALFVIDPLPVTEPMRTAAGDKPLEFTITMQIGPTGNHVVVIPLSQSTVDPGADCAHRDSVSYKRARTNEGGTLGGVVVRAKPSVESPIAHVRVLLIDIKGAQVAEQQTNERGEFQFKSIPAGRYSLEVRHTEYNNLKSRVFWIARENQTYITLAPVRVGMIVVCE